MEPPALLPAQPAAQYAEGAGGASAGVEGGMAGLSVQQRSGADQPQQQQPPPQPPPQQQQPPQQQPASDPVLPFQRSASPPPGQLGGRSREASVMSDSSSSSAAGGHQPGGQQHPSGVLANEASAQWEQVRSTINSRVSKFKENVAVVTANFPQMGAAGAPPLAATPRSTNPWNAWGMGSSPPGASGGGSSGGEGQIALDEYLIAKRALIDLSRSSMLYAKPELACIEGMARIKEERLQKVLLELNSELDTHAEELGLDPAEQLRELTAAISTHKQADAACTTKAELLSRLLEVAWNAIVKMDEEVAPTRFVAAREALHALRAALKELYMEECIGY